MPNVSKKKWNKKTVYQTRFSCISNSKQPNILQKRAVQLAVRR